MKETIKQHSKKELTNKIKKLYTTNFVKCKKMNSWNSKTIWVLDRYKYPCNINIISKISNLERALNPDKTKHQIFVNGNISYPFSPKGIKQAVDYINLDFDKSLDWIMN